MLQIHISSKKLFSILICLIFFCIVINCSSDIDLPKRRIKRKIVFSKSSKFFFRLNGKNNVLNYTDILVHGYAIRVNYDLPDTLPKRHQFFKRDVENELENISETSDLNLYSCVIKRFCDVLPMISTSDTCGMFCQIGNIITSSQGNEARFLKSFLGRCEYYTNQCLQYSQSELSSYNENLIKL